MNIPLSACDPSEVRKMMDREDKAWGVPWGYRYALFGIISAIVFGTLF